MFGLWDAKMNETFESGLKQLPNFLFWERQLRKGHSTATVKHQAHATGWAQLTVAADICRHTMRLQASGALDCS